MHRLSEQHEKVLLPWLMTLNLQFIYFLIGFFSQITFSLVSHALINQSLCEHGRRAEMYFGLRLSPPKITATRIKDNPHVVYYALN